MMTPGPLLRRLTPIALFIGLAGCGKDAGPLSPLTEARQRWEALHLTTYEYVLTIQCFCSDQVTQPVRITVTDGAVTARVYVAGGAPVDSSLAGRFPSIDGLFDLAQAAVEGGAASVQVDYDVRFGYPVRIAIDNIANAVDDEVTYLVSPFMR